MMKFCCDMCKKDISGTPITKTIDNLEYDFCKSCDTNLKSVLKGAGRPAPQSSNIMDKYLKGNQFPTQIPYKDLWKDNTSLYPEITWKTSIQSNADPIGLGSSLENGILNTSINPSNISASMIEKMYKDLEGIPPPDTIYLSGNMTRPMLAGCDMKYIPVNEGV